jgi:hypothetical protein
MQPGTSSQSAHAAKVTSQEDPHRWRWQTPTRYGAAEAVMSMGTIAAPLLAGFSLASFVLIFTLTSSEVRYGDVAALLLLLAAVFLVQAVQATFWARENHVTPAQLREWWDDADEPRTRVRLEREQAEHMKKFQFWCFWARIAYDVGLLCLLAGLTVLAIPPTTGNSPVRWAAVGVGAIAFVGELSWVIGARISKVIGSRVSERPGQATATTGGLLIFLFPLYLWVVYLSSGRHT